MTSLLLFVDMAHVVLVLLWTPLKQITTSILLSTLRCPVPLHEQVTLSPRTIMEVKVPGALRRWAKTPLIPFAMGNILWVSVGTPLLEGNVLRHR